MKYQSIDLSNGLRVHIPEPPKPKPNYTTHLYERCVSQLPDDRFTNNPDEADCVTCVVSWRFWNK